MGSIQKKHIPRRVLCLNTEKQEILDLLPAEQWQPVFVKTLAQCRQAITDESIQVVLVRIVSGDNDALNLIREIMMARQDLRAIAIIESISNLNSEQRRSVGTLFSDYLTPPLSLDRLLHAIGHAYGMASLYCCAHNEREYCAGEEYPLLGVSEAIVRLREQLSRISQANAPVMICGESGTGKELVARNIHYQSSVASAPFVAVNMAAIPENLIQTELFGHEKGAFTGAEKQRIGHIESALNGTLFLDEIGDLPLHCQSNLLRFLQEGTIARVGSSREIPVNVRIITATHVDLEKAVEEGHFREDLYYRLNVLRLDMPPLREREEDVILLAKYFFEHFRGLSATGPKGLSEQALFVIRQHEWRGNVRELINRVQRAVVMCRGDLIYPEDLELERRQAVRSIPTLANARAKIEESLLRSALMDTGYNVSETSRLLGVSRVTLYKMIEKYHVSERSDQAGVVEASPRL